MAWTARITASVVVAFSIFLRIRVLVVPAAGSKNCCAAKTGQGSLSTEPVLLQLMSKVEIAYLADPDKPRLINPESVPLVYVQFFPRPELKESTGPQCLAQRGTAEKIGELFADLHSTYKVSTITITPKGFQESSPRGFQESQTKVPLDFGTAPRLDVSQSFKGIARRSLGGLWRLTRTLEAL